MLRRISLLSLLAAALSGCGGWHLFVPSESTGFHARAGYQVYVPKAHDPGRAWPVILYLHGGGEAGTGNVKQTQVGLGPTLWRSRGTLPFVVVMPQCPLKKAWPSPVCEETALRALSEAMKEWHGDPARVYLTGNSMGGHGTLALASRHPGMFAAIAPIGGRVKRASWFPLAEDAKLVFATSDIYAEMAQRIGPVPAWFFHGAEDSLTPATEAGRVVEALRALGGEVRFTVYPGVGHAGSWERAYADPALFEWLAEHRR
jgi:predicted peptidase